MITFYVLSTHFEIDISFWSLGSVLSQHQLSNGYPGLPFQVIYLANLSVHNAEKLGALRPRM